MLINQWKRTGYPVDFSVHAESRVKIKQSKKIDKYSDLAKELKKKLWNIMMTVVPIIVDKGL